MRSKIASLESSVADYKSMEATLRESEKRYRALLRQSSDGIYIFDPRTACIVEANDQFLAMLRYERGEIQTLPLHDIVMLDKDVIDARVLKTPQDDTRVLGPSRYRCKDGSVIDVVISTTLITHKNTPAVMVSVRNITEQKQIEEELHLQAIRSREQAELLEIADDAIVVLDMEDRIVFWNHGAEDKYGWAKEEVIGKQAHKVLHTSFSGSLKEIKEKLEKKGRWEGELTQRKRSGEEIVMGSRWALRRDRRGKPIAIMEINNDITQRKRAEAALQKAKEDLELRVAERTVELQNANERLLVELNRRKRAEEVVRDGAERYRNLFENSPLGIYRMSPDGRILMANPTMVRMLGYGSFGELAAISRKGDHQYPSLRKKMEKKLEREEKVRGFETKWKRRDKSVVFVRENAKAIRATDGTFLYYEGTVEDITEQKKAEEKIHSYEEQLRSLASELSLAEEKERRRIATTLHDHIGQILAISKIKLGALLQSAPTTGVLEQVREIREHVEQAIQYTRSLTFELSPPILYDLGLESALEWLTEQTKEQHGIRCEFEADGKAAPVSDEIRIFLFTAVRELLMNVAKHAQAKIAKVTIRRVKDNMVIHVADDGTGFVASKTSSYLDKNKGFGLFSIRERLRHLGGQMDVRAARGRGTRVVLIAPLTVEARQTRRVRDGY
ncbi:MAG: Oxygen sensor histidine kinase NreB [Syntrophorhabdus sp. PtaU1.Bin002]|nr:MAG: Oxygen sensor histidine kinase NreB [Syntrophorhabdus sp. PtaU1.Bin002]